MKLIALIFVYFVVNNIISAVPVGVIHNASLMMISSSSITINLSTCDQCVCAMLMSTGNSSIVSFNCYVQNTAVVICELFTMTNYQIFTFYQMETNINSTFYFLQLPPSMTNANGRTSFSSLLRLSFYFDTICKLCRNKEWKYRKKMSQKDQSSSSLSQCFCWCNHYERNDFCLHFRRRVKLLP
jgi:hypothetical protein